MNELSLSLSDLWSKHTLLYWSKHCTQRIPCTRILIINRIYNKPLFLSNNKQISIGQRNPCSGYSLCKLWTDEPKRYSALYSYTVYIQSKQSSFFNLLISTTLYKSLVLALRPSVRTVPSPWRLARGTAPYDAQVLVWSAGSDPEKKDIIKAWKGNDKWKNITTLKIPIPNDSFNKTMT